MFVLCLLLLLVSSKVLSEKCEIDLGRILCKNTNFESFIYDLDPINKEDLFRHIPQLIVTNSNFSNIRSFSLHPLEITRLALSNCSVEFIEDWAFEDYNLEYLALNNNKLKNMSFVTTLPKNLKTLFLDGNEFEKVQNVFGNLINLIVLTLGNCKIKSIDPYTFSNLRNLRYLNISHNKLVAFYGYLTSINLRLLLSFNNINRLDFKNSQLDFSELDISHNPIKNIDILKKFTFGNLNLASTNIDKIVISQLSRKIYLGLNLSNTEFGSLQSDFINLDVDEKCYDLILFNSSITSIEPHTFDNVGCATKSILPYLDLSFNFITELKTNLFTNAFIGTLDLSKNLIQKIHDNTFSGLSLINTLNLSHNYLSFLNEKVFIDLRDVSTVDLSFNNFKKLNNNLFIGCANLQTLNLSDSKIEIIQEGAFTGITGLLELNLENNLIKKLNLQSFNNIPLRILNLRNNSFAAFNFSTFRNISVDKIILSNNKVVKLVNSSVDVKKISKEINLAKSGIRIIESRAFYGLTKLEILDLSNNLIEEILPGTFIYLKNLFELNLSGNKIMSFSADSFAFGNHLSQLNITFFDTHLRSKTFVYLNYVKNLSIFDSRINLFEKDCFKGFKYLEKMYLNNTEVRGLIPGAFKGLDSLTNFDAKTLFKNIQTIGKGTFEGLQMDYMDLSELRIRSLESEAFKGLPKLVKLLLNQNKLTMIRNSTFLGLNLLKFLDLSKNTISQLEVNAFLGLNFLQELNLRDNNLTTLSLGTFQHFPTLEVLNLRENHINKLLTGTFSNLKRLQVLDLSYNNITKLKMESIVTLSNLKKLDLTANHLISMEHLDLIKSLRQLEVIGLNGNKWKCDNLVSMLIAFQNYSVSWLSTESATFTHENIDGIKCFDICNFFYCVDEEDLTWRP